MQGEIWMCWSVGEGMRPWALYWTASYTRRTSIALYDKVGRRAYAKERRAGRVICKRTRLVVDSEPGGET